MKLFKSAHVYAPQYLGQKDVLIAGDKIIAVEDNINLIANSFIEVIQTDGLILTPGFVITCAIYWFTVCL